jgi:hypothetical protein
VSASAATSTTLACLGLLVAGCQGNVVVLGSAGQQDGTACPYQLPDGSCVGVPLEPACEAETRTDGVACSAVIEVADDAGLHDALAQASPGACVALGPGSYGKAVLPPGVSLLGRGAACVTVEAVEVDGGEGATVRGMTVLQGMKLGPATTGATIYAVRVTGSDADGLEIGVGASVSVSYSEIRGTARYAVGASGAGSLVMVASVLTSTAGPGLWAECDQGCGCADALTIVVRNCIIRDVKVAGVSLMGARATITNLEISGNSVDQHFQPGNGLSASGCSVLTASGLWIFENSGFGALIDGSTAILGEALDEQTILVDGQAITIKDSLRGLWIQHVDAVAGQRVGLAHALLTGNAGVSLAVAGYSGAVTIEDARIHGTQMVALPALVDGVSAGALDVGDGLLWGESSQVSVDGLTVGSSARQGALIDGPVVSGSSLAHVTLTDGDEHNGIIQQSLAPGGASPTLGPGVAPLTTSAGELLPVPLGPG